MGDRLALGLLTERQLEILDEYCDAPIAKGMPAEEIFAKIIQPCAVRGSRSVGLLLRAEIGDKTDEHRA